MKWLWGIFLLVGCLSAWDSQGAVIPSPDGEKRSLIFFRTGLALMGSDAADETGYQKARKTAEEAVHNHAKSVILDKVLDKSLNLDVEIETNPDGKSFKLLKEERLPPVVKGSTKTISVRLEVEVAYRLKPTLPEDVLLAQEKLPLTVRIWTDKKEYRQGEKITFYLQGNRDFHARVINKAADGSMVQLLPNQFQPSDRFQAKTLYTLPPTTDKKMKFEVGAPFGQESVTVYASDAAIGTVAIDKQMGGFAFLKGSSDLASEVRQIKPTHEIMDGQGKKLEFVPFYEVRWNLTTKP